MGTKKIKKIFFSVFIFWGLLAHAQNVQPSASISKTIITIGDEAKLNLKIIAPSSAKINWPVVQDTITAKIDILSKSKIDTVFSEDKKQMTLSQTLTFTSFDSGFVTIPPFKFIYGKINDSTPLFAETNPLLFEVKLPAVDTTKAIKDIKEPLKVPLTFKEVAPYILLVIVIAAIIYLGIWYYRKRKKKEPIFKISKPKLPPHEIALEELEKLRQKKLWQNNKIKEFYTELTDIVRKYIEGRFEIKALEMTTDAILEAFKRIDVSDDAKSKLKQMLVLADMVKFAKEQPVPTEIEQSFNNALDYVKSTIMVIKEKEELKSEIQDQKS